MSVNLVSETTAKATLEAFPDFFLVQLNVGSIRELNQGVMRHEIEGNKAHAAVFDKSGIRSGPTRKEMSRIAQWVNLK